MPVKESSGGFDAPQTECDGLARVTPEQLNWRAWRVPESELSVDILSAYLTAFPRGKRINSNRAGRTRLDNLIPPL